jgi:O-antigen/teichoic acid export membrane protein
VSGIATKAIAFFLLPIFTYYLLPSDYGMIALISSSTLAMTPFINLGVSDIITVEYKTKPAEEYLMFQAACLTLPFFLCISVFLLTVLFSSFFSWLTTLPAGVIYAIPFLAYFTFSFDFIATIIRNDEKPVLFSVISFLRTAIELSIAVMLIVVFRLQWVGRLASLLIAGGISFLFMLLYIYHRKQPLFFVSRQYFRQILVFGLPTLPTYLMIFVLYNADKFILSQVLHNKNDVGLYSVAYQIGYLLQVLVTAIYTAVLPKIYDWMADGGKNARIKIVKAFYSAFGLMILAGIGLILLSPLIYRFFLNAKYHSSLSILPYFVICYVLWTSYNFFIPIIFFLKKNHYLYLLSASTIVVSLVSGYLAVSRYGMIGACYSNLLAFLFLTVVLFIIIQKIYYLPWLFFLGRKETNLSARQ